MIEETRLPQWGVEMEATRNKSLNKTRPESKPRDHDLMDDIDEMEPVTSPPVNNTHRNTQVAQSRIAKKEKAEKVIERLVGDAIARQ
jgi:hypothetical protein